MVELQHRDVSGKGSCHVSDAAGHRAIDCMTREPFPYDRLSLMCSRKAASREVQDLLAPRAAFALHLLEGLVRSPQLLAEVVFAAGAGALAQVGRYLAARQVD
jgi:hypothetical protein